MNGPIQPQPIETLPAAAPFRPEAPDRAAIDRAVEQATRRIAPLWPLRHFVAVNPFLGVADHDFASAARVMARVAGASMTAPKPFFADAIRSGRITRTDLAAALAEADPVAGAPATVEELRSFAFVEDRPVPVELAPTVAEVAAELTGADWGRFVTHAVSSWAASHFDEGQSFWRSPWRDLPPYTAWHSEAALDRTPEGSGIPGFRAIVGRLPATAAEATADALARLGVPEDGLETYLHRLLMTIGGWAAYVRYHVWESELYGGTNTELAELLAVRLAWDAALLEAFREQGLAEAWERRRAELAAPGIGAAAEADLAARLLLQAAFEKAVQREVLAKVSGAGREAPPARKAVQATFCIDVRSEVFRRALESVDPSIETLGFAGFFGFPIEYIPIGDEKGGAQCPVLLTPQVVVRESLRGADPDQVEAECRKRDLRRDVAKAWRSFKFAAVSCFGFVGPVGLLYAPKLVTDSLGRTRPVKHPGTFGLDAEVRARLAPELEPATIGGRETGMTPEQRLAVAEGVLRAMSMTSDFARLVLLIGHGSTTVNNPHATGLDCGACGGHTGEANARFAAAVLQDPEVRKGLRERGIDVPDDTVFIGCQHDTTTDEIAIFDEELVPASHAADLARLREQLAWAGQIARTERARLLYLEPGAETDPAIRGRSRDWSQVRPEWGLAGCNAFVAAPRHRTQGIDLGGRCFLHSYDWRQDEGFGVLELIMTAPMVVASWISLQYYGSTVDNRVFGSGSKVLHNVVGTLGVLEGNGGDLRVGLPWQSVHDGERLVHEPARLNVVIEAPIPEMNAILEQHESVRQLLDNGWLNLFAMDDKARVSHRYTGGLAWEALAADDPAVPGTPAAAG